MTIRNAGGAQDALTTVSVPAATGLLPTLVSPQPVFSQVASTNLTLQWTTTSSQATTTLGVWLEAANETLWQYACGSAKSVGYDTDGNSLELLQAGHAYAWWVASSLGVGSSDSRVTITREGRADGNFVITGTAPVLEEVDVQFYSQVDSQGAQYARYLCVPTFYLTDSAGSREHRLRLVG